MLSPDQIIMIDMQWKWKKKQNNMKNTNSLMLLHTDSHVQSRKEQKRIAVDMLLNS